MSISSHIQLLGEDSEDCDQVVYESIDDYIDMQTFERNVKPSPYVDPTVTHSPVYSNTTAVLSNHAPTIAVTPSSQHAHPRPRVGPKPQLKEVLLKPYPPSTPPPNTCPSKKVAKNKPVVFKVCVGVHMYVVCLCVLNVFKWFSKWHHSVAEMPSFDSMVCVLIVISIFTSKRLLNKLHPRLHTLRKDRQQNSTLS